MIKTFNLDGGVLRLWDGSLEILPPIGPPIFFLTKGQTLEVAQEIIRLYGDRCEWKETSPDADSMEYKTDCGQSYGFEDELTSGSKWCKYCPNCGRPVELVKHNDN